MAHFNSNPDRRRFLQGAGLTAGFIFPTTVTTVAGAQQATPNRLTTREQHGL